MRMVGNMERSASALTTAFSEMMLPWGSMKARSVRVILEGLAAGPSLPEMPSMVTAALSAPGAA